MVGNLEELAAVMAARGYPSLGLTREALAGETHLSVFPAASSRGLRAVFDRNANAAEWAALPPHRSRRG